MDYEFPYNKEKEQNKIEMKGSVPMNYAEVINDDIEREKNIEDAFKEKNKETQEFIKKNDERETKKVKSKDLKKMHLEESLFEDYIDSDEDKLIVDLIKNKVKELGMNKSKYSMRAERYGDDGTYTLRFSAPNDYIALFAMLLHESPSINAMIEYFDDLESIKYYFDEFPTYDDLYKFASESWWGDGDDFIIELKNLNTGETLYEGESNDEVDDDDYDYDIDENFLSTINHTSDDLSEDNEILDEATAVLDKPKTNVVYYYKKKREPLADIIMSELTIGEYPVYKKSASGKFNPTNGPCLNIADENIGVNSDNNGEYILARVDTEEDLEDIRKIADKYDREFKSEFDRWARGPKYIGKIYVSEQDWDEPYIDPNAKVKGA